MEKKKQKRALREGGQWNIGDLKVEKTVMQVEWFTLEGEWLLRVWVCENLQKPTIQ